MSPLVRAAALTRRVADRLDVDRVHLEVAHGECLAVTGPADGGRRTLLRLLATILRPTGGELTIAGIDAIASPLAARGQVMLAAADAVNGDGLTVREYLTYVATARGIRHHPAARLAAALDIAGVAGGVAAATVPRAGRGRLALAAAVLATPPIVLIDPPAAGADPAWAGAVVACATALRREGTAVIIGVDVDDVPPALCDSAMAMAEGRVWSVSRLAGQRHGDACLVVTGDSR